MREADCSPGCRQVDQRGSEELQFLPRFHLRRRLGQPIAIHPALAVFANALLPSARSLRWRNQLSKFDDCMATCNY